MIEKVDVDMLAGRFSEGLNCLCSIHASSSYDDSWDATLGQLEFAVEAIIDGHHSGAVATSHIPTSDSLRVLLRLRTRLSNRDAPEPSTELRKEAAACVAAILGTREASVLLGLDQASSEGEKG